MRLRRVIWNPWQSNGKLRNMKNQSFEVLCHKQIRNARRGSKEKSNMKHSRWQSCQPLLEHFLESNLYMIYVVSNLRKSKIQCFKRCIIRSWNEGVTAIGSQSLQAKGRILHSCEISLLLWSDFAALFVRLRNLADLVFTCEMVLSASQYLCTNSFRSFLQIFLYKFPFFSL